MTIVLDASVWITALVERGDRADWARGQLRGEELVAPHLLPAEVMSGLRRGVLSGRIGARGATAALREVQQTRVELLAFPALADRVWQLRDTVTPYDAWYVAVAESIDAPLVTLDLSLAGAPGPRCRFVVPG